MLKEVVMHSHMQQEKLFSPVRIALAMLLMVPVFVAGATVPVGTTPYAVAVNPVSNKIYVANSGSNNVTVIDGVTNTTTTVPMVGLLEGFPEAVAVNPVTNKIYVANFYNGVFGDSGPVIVI